MRRREFLIGGGALALSVAGGSNLFNRSRAFAGGSPGQGLIPFNKVDTLENIRAILKQNDFRFEVEHNWPYDVWGYAATPQPINASQIVIPLAPAPADPLLPAKFDLRNIDGRSYISPIRDQSINGMCQHFATTAAAEAAYNRRNGLSDDDCIIFSPWFTRSISLPGDVNDLGLLYGLTKSREPWLTPTGLEGTCREEDFLFAAFDDHGGNNGGWPPDVQREAARLAPRITMRRCSAVYPHNYWETTNQIKWAIYRYGAVTATIMQQSAFDAYKSGVYEDGWVYPSKLPYYAGEGGHSISLIGWDDNPPEGGNGGCWILRNSWGESWGEGGYMRIRYFSCFVNTTAAYFQAESPSDGTLRICGTVDAPSTDYNTVVTLSGDDNFSCVVFYGNFGFATLRPGRYLVTPSNPALIFYPAGREITLTDADAPLVIFSGKKNTAYIPNY